MSSTNPIHTLKKSLSDTPLSHIISSTPEKPLISASPNHTIKEVFELLNRHRIRSVPVIRLVASDSTTDSNDATKSTALIEMVDCADIMYYFVEFYLNRKGDLDDFLKTEVGEITNFSGRNPPPLTFPLTTKLSKVVSHLKKGMRRILVENEKKELIAIVTHTDMMRLAEKKLHNTELGKKTVGELKVAQPLEAQVDESTNVLEAFEKIRKHKLEYLPIVSSSDGSIISVISVRDIKLLIVKGKEVLELSVIDYISQARQAFAGATESFPIFFCKKDYPLLNTVQRLLKTHVHRLILTDETKKPHGEVSVRNLLEHIFLDEEEVKE